MPRAERQISRGVWHVSHDSPVQAVKLYGKGKGVVEAVDRIAPERLQALRRLIEE